MLEKILITSDFKVSLVALYIQINTIMYMYPMFRSSEQYAVLSDSLWYEKASIHSTIVIFSSKRI